MNAPSIILFDGACGLCHALVRFVVPRDPHGRFRFAPLQSDVGRTLLVRHDLDPDALDTLVLIEGGTACVRSDAALRILRQLGLPWSMLATLRLLPHGLRDGGYRFIARHRHRWFRRREACEIADATVRSRLLDDDGEAPAHARSESAVV